jgi:uncharacterized membrane protein
MQRVTLLGPVFCTFIGAASGINFVMFITRDSRIHLDESLPFFIAGGLAGHFSGLFIMTYCNRHPSISTIFVTALLMASISAPFGWISHDTSSKAVQIVSMIFCALAGGAIGLGIGLCQVALDKTKTRKNERKLANSQVEAEADQTRPPTNND